MNLLIIQRGPRSPANPLQAAPSPSSLTWTPGFLKHLVRNVEGGHLPSLQILRGQAEDVLLQIALFLQLPSTIFAMVTVQVYM